MCGISGELALEPGRTASSVALAAMTDSLAHRGPDGEGHFIEGVVGLGHRLLAITDPTPSGHQPMAGTGGRYHLVFDGEIYNAPDLRRSLENDGHAFKGQSDTEVLLRLFETRGADCLNHLNGMFAFAVWDREAQSLFLARDPFGIKPLYYRNDGKRLLFASEVKAILAALGRHAEIDAQALDDYVTFQYALDGKTLFKSVSKLLPGCWMRIDRSGKIETRRYWKPSFVDHGVKEHEAAEMLRCLLEDSVRLRTRGDAPIGFHLSGGIDSASIAGLAAPLMDNPLKTFTAGFRDGEGFDDTGFAALSAEFFGTRHFETFPTHHDFERDFTHLIRHLDEPVAAPGAFAQFAVARLAAPHVKVVLGGQGADELIGGYARYYLAAVTAAAKAEAHGAGLSGLPLASLLENLGQLEAYRPLIAEVWPQGMCDSPADLYLRLIRRGECVRRTLHGDLWSGLSGYRAEHRYREVFCELEGLDLLNRILHYETTASLPALLQVEDRVSMAWSLEARVPFLDVRIAELMFSLPASVKFKDGRLKSILRGAMKDVVPAQILGRSNKVGFPVPLRAWFDGPLRDWVRDMLLGERTRQRGLFSQAEVCRMLDGEGAFGRGVWGLVCLETWFRLWVDGEGLTAQVPRRFVPEVGAA